MKFSDFSLSFSHVVKGSPLAWKKGKVFCYGSESKVIKDLAARIPWSFELRITEGPCSITALEGYTLDISCEKVLLSAPSERGLLYGMWTLIRFGELEDKAECTITDLPIAPQRGLKLYLPPPDESSIREFYAIIDLALRYKYNFLMLELGGAMEYLSHPEINEAYLKYASFMNEYPAKAMKIQNSFPWRKNSIHTENGGGRILFKSRSVRSSPTAGKGGLRSFRKSLHSPIVTTCWRRTPIWQSARKTLTLIRRVPLRRDITHFSSTF